MSVMDNFYSSSMLVRLAMPYLRFFVPRLRYLQAQGVRITTGTIVDATILHAPTSTKNREQQRDPEMHQTKKGKHTSG